MLRRTPTDLQGAAFSVSTRLADTYPCSCGQQGRLLLLRVDRCLQSSPEQTIQSIMNAAARLIFYVRRSEHVTPLLHDLHWLRVPERIQFRLCSDIPVSPWFCAVIPGQALLLLGLKPKGHKNQTTKYACILNLGVQY